MGLAVCLRQLGREPAKPVNVRDDLDATALSCVARRRNQGGAERFLLGDTRVEAN